jgi:hypothetical protein
MSRAISARWRSRRVLTGGGRSSPDRARCTYETLRSLLSVCWHLAVGQPAAWLRCGCEGSPSRWPGVEGGVPKILPVHHTIDHGVSASAEFVRPGFDGSRSARGDGPSPAAHAPTLRAGESPLSLRWIFGHRSRRRCMVAPAGKSNAVEVPALWCRCRRDRCRLSTNRAPGRSSAGWIDPTDLFGRRSDERSRPSRGAGMDGRNAGGWHAGGASGARA